MLLKMLKSVYLELLLEYVAKYTLGDVVLSMIELTVSTSLYV